MKIPSHIAEGKSPPFPAGTYVGKLTEAKQEWYASDAKNKPDTKDSARLQLTFKEITPVEGPQVGARPLMQRLDIIRPAQVGGPAISIVDVAQSGQWDESIPFGIRQSAALFSQLALAFGAASVDGTGNVDVELDEFITALSGGVFNNREVLFTVEQRTYASKTQKNPDGTGKSMTVSNVTAFASVGASVAPSPSEVEAETTGPSLRTR